MNKSQLSLIDITPPTGKYSSMSFKQAFKTLLKDNPSKLWGPKEVAEALMQGGFKNNSKDFTNTVRTMIMNVRKSDDDEIEITHIKNGYMYKYKEKGSDTQLVASEPLN